MGGILLECYSRPGTPFGAKGPFYDPSIGHRGQDYYWGARQPIMAYESGTIEYTGRTGGLGAVLGMRLDAGGFAGWAHLYGIRSFINGRVKAGDVIAYAAGAGDQPGSLWDGAHIHTTLSPVSAYNAAVGNTPLLNPAPRISAARSGTAAIGRPTTLPETMAAQVRKRASRMETAIQNNKTGAIYLLDSVSRTATPCVNLGEWLAYELQGWKYAALNPNDFAATLANYTVR